MYARVRATLTLALNPKAAFSRQTKVGKLVLTNFKKLPNSCLHTSNSRQINDVVQWHLRRVAACVLVLFYVNRRRRNRKRWKNRKFWTKPYISRNSSLGPYNTLVQELRTEDAAAFTNFVGRGRNVPQIGTIVSFFDKTKRCVPFLKSVRHFAMITQNT